MSQVRAPGATHPLSPTTQTLARPGVAPLRSRAPAAPQRPGAPRALARPSDRSAQPGPVDSRSEVTANASALQDALSANAAALESLPNGPAAQQWFFAVDGAPVGPLQVHDVRQRITGGTITGESLAWREGLGDWKKASEIADLTALFGAAPRNGRPTSGVQARSPLHDDDDGDDPATVMQAVPEEIVRAARQALGEPFAPAPSPFLPNAFSYGHDVDPLAPAPLMNPASTAFSVAAAADASGIGASGAFHAGGEPVTAAAFGPGPGSSNPSYVDPIAAPHKKGPPWIPIAMLAAALAFGITAAVVIFLPKPNAPVPAETKPPQLAPSARAVDPAVPPPDPSAPIAQIEDSKGPGTKPASGGGSGKGSSAPAAAGAADLKGLLGGGGNTVGPSAGGTGGGAGAGSGSRSQQQIERTVQSYMPGVKRGCWDTSNAPSGDVRAAITIGASGAVQNVSSTSGDPVLARCIETKVRGWKFPPPGGTQVVNVPFKFLRQ